MNGITKAMILGLVLGLMLAGNAQGQNAVDLTGKSVSREELIQALKPKFPPTPAAPAEGPPPPQGTAPAEGPPPPQGPAPADGSPPAGQGPAASAPADAGTSGASAPSTPETQPGTAAPSPGGPEPSVGPSASGSEPSAPSVPAPPADPPRVALTIPFEYDSDRLTPEAAATLKELGVALNSDQLRPYRFRFEGHTDSKGSADYNLVLSLRRAKAVLDYLVEVSGVEIARVEALGMGETRPLAPDRPADAANRRVEVVTLLP
jgi:outer membrane protein OmpA-like peptidoglycan-associated protein